MKLEALAWFILFLPLAAATVITLFTQRDRALSAKLSISAIVIGFILSLVVFANFRHAPAPVELSATWLAVGDLHIDFGVRLDPLSLIMLLIVTGVGGVPPARLNQIDNAIVLEDYSTAPPTLADKARFGFDSQRFLIGAVGRLSEEKGFHHLIEVVGRLVRDGHPVGLIIAGEGHLREQLQQQINDLDLHDHVRLSGFLTDPRELYRAIDLFVLSSLREGLPNVVLEAMASQRAVVTTNCNGIPTLVQHRQNGMIVPTDNVDALHSAIRESVISDDRRMQLATAGRQTIEDGFCFDRRMKNVVDVYRKLSPELAGLIREEAEGPGDQPPGASPRFKGKPDAGAWRLMLQPGAKAT